jgi:hypothetical protein
VDGGAFVRDEGFEAVLGGEGGGTRS